MDPVASLWQRLCNTVFLSIISIYYNTFCLVSDKLLYYKSVILNVFGGVNSNEIFLWLEELLCINLKVVDDFKAIHI